MADEEDELGDGEVLEVEEEEEEEFEAPASKSDDLLRVLTPPRCRMRSRGLDFAESRRPETFTRRLMPTKSSPTRPPR